MPTTASHPELMQSLLRRYQTQGCAVSFRRLVEHYSPLVEKTARHLLREDAEAARDVTQRVFTDFARLAPRLHSEGPPAGWLHRHTVFVASHYREAEERRQRREAEYSRRLHSDNADDIARTVEQAAAVHRLIERLPETDRRIVLARFWEKQSLREIGAALGLSEEATQKRLARALEKLRVRLGVPRGRHVAALGVLLGISSSSQATANPSVAVSASTLSPVMGGGASSNIIYMATTTEKTMRWAAVGCLLLAIGGGVSFWRYSASSSHAANGENSSIAMEQAGLPGRPSSLTDEEVREKIKQTSAIYWKAMDDYYTDHPDHKNQYAYFKRLEEELRNDPYHNKLNQSQDKQFVKWARKGLGRIAERLCMLKALAELWNDPILSSTFENYFIRGKSYLSEYESLLLNGHKSEARDYATDDDSIVDYLKSNMPSIDKRINEIVENKLNQQEISNLHDYSRLKVLIDTYNQFFTSDAPEEIKQKRYEIGRYQNIIDNRFYKNQ